MSLAGHSTVTVIDSVAAGTECRSVCRPMSLAGAPQARMHARPVGLAQAAPAAGFAARPEYGLTVGDATDTSLSLAGLSGVTMASLPVA